MTKKKLTLCFLGDASSIHMRKWASFFAQHGHDVHLLSFAPYALQRMPGIAFHLLAKKIPVQTHGLSYTLNLIPNLRQIQHTIKKIQPHAVHAHEAVNYGRLAALSGFHPLIITPWGTDISIKSKAGIQKVLTRFTLKRADLVTTDGENIKKEMVEMGIDPNKIAVVRFGVDTKLFYRMPKDAALLASLELEGKKIVISLRALARSHGVITLINAIPFVIRRFPNARFIIVGDLNYDNPYGESILQKTRLLNIGNLIRFTGFLLNEELSRYLNLADVYVSTALSDGGLPASTGEAMACELPVVTTDAGDSRMFINDGKGGFVISKNNHRALARRIIEVLKDDHARDKFGGINRQAIMENNDYETEMGKMETLYYKL